MKARSIRLLALIMALGMTLSVCGITGALGESGSQWPEYLNMDSVYPIIKDEYAGDITLKMVIVQDSTAAEWDDLYISKYLKEKYNAKIYPMHNEEVDIASADIRRRVSDRKDILKDVPSSVAEYIEKRGLYQ